MDIERQNEIDDLIAVMKTPEGRRFVWRKLSEWATFATPFVGEAPDVTSFNCGVQSCGFDLLSEITEACPEFYLLMQKEAIDKQLEEKRRNKHEENESE
jgi:predicted nucleotide-binding protein (sugar kinase/HSP70/actin superfamily)